MIDFLAHPVPDKAQSRQRPLDQTALRRSMPGHHGIVFVWMVPDQRGIDDGYPPDGLTDHRERPRLVRCPDPGKPFSRVTHRSDRPLQRTYPGHRITHLLAVPRYPAASRTKPGMLAPRREDSAALLTAPDISHPVMLRVTRIPCRSRTVTVGPCGAYGLPTVARCALLSELGAVAAELGAVAAELGAVAAGSITGWLDGFSQYA